MLIATRFPISAAAPQESIADVGFALKPKDDPRTLLELTQHVEQALPGVNVQWQRHMLILARGNYEGSWNVLTTYDLLELLGENPGRAGELHPDPNAPWAYLLRTNRLLDNQCEELRNRLGVHITLLSEFSDGGGIVYRLTAGVGNILPPREYIAQVLGFKL